MTARVALGAVGLVLGCYGGWLLLTRQDVAQLVDVGVWLVAGVVVHDVLLSAAVVVGGVLLARLVPPTWRAPATAGLVVLGTVTLAAVPVLGRFGARSDNPTLLDRDYVAGWLVLAALVAGAVVVGAVVAGLARRRRAVREGE